jgi:hypothetical protein
MPIPIGAIAKVAGRNWKPLAAGAGGVAGGAFIANQLNGGKNIPIVNPSSVSNIDYKQVIDASQTITYNVFAGRDADIRTDAETTARPDTSVDTSQKTTSTSSDMLIPALALGAAAIIGGIALWRA